MKKVWALISFFAFFMGSAAFASGGTFKGFELKGCNETFCFSLESEHVEQGFFGRLTFQSGQFILSSRKTGKVVKQISGEGQINWQYNEIVFESRAGHISRFDMKTSAFSVR